MDQISLLRAIGLLSALGEPDDDEKVNESSVSCESVHNELTTAYEGKSTASLLAPISKFWPRSKLESPRSEGRRLTANEFSFDNEKCSEPKSKRIYLPSLDSDHELVGVNPLSFKSNLLEVIPLNSFSSSTLATSTKSSSFSTLVTRIEVPSSTQSILCNFVKYPPNITTESPIEEFSNAGVNLMKSTTELSEENSHRNIVDDTGTSAVFDLANTLKMLAILGEDETDDHSMESFDYGTAGGAHEDDSDRFAADILEGGQKNVPVNHAECHDGDDETLGRFVTHMAAPEEKTSDSRSVDKGDAQKHIAPAIVSEKNSPSVELPSSHHSEFNRRVKELLEAIIASDNSDAEDDCSYRNNEGAALFKNHLDGPTVDTEKSSYVGGDEVGENGTGKRRGDRVGEDRESKCDISHTGVEDRATDAIDDIFDPVERRRSHDISDKTVEIKYESASYSGDAGHESSSTVSPASSSESFSISKSFSNNCFRCGCLSRSMVVTDVRRNSDSICVSDKRDSASHCKCISNDTHNSVFRGCGVVVASVKTRGECIESDRERDIESKSIRSSSSVGVGAGVGVVALQDTFTLSASNLNSNVDLNIVTSGSRDSNNTSIGSPQSASISFS